VTRMWDVRSGAETGEAPGSGHRVRIEVPVDPTADSIEFGLVTKSLGKPAVPVTV